MGRDILWGRYRSSLFMILKSLEILFDIFCVCAYSKSYADQWSAQGNSNPLLSLNIPHLILTLLYCWLYSDFSYGGDKMVV